MMDKQRAKALAKEVADGNIVREFEEYAYYAHDLSMLDMNDGVMVRPIEFPNGRIQISIIVFHDTGIAHIRNAWWKILKWKVALAEWQEPIPDDDEVFYEEMANVHPRLSHKVISERVNKRIGEYLAEYVKYQKEKEENEQHYQNENEILGLEEGYYVWLREYMEKYHDRMAAFKFADDLLRYCRPRLSEDERHEILTSAIQNIKEGYPPFLPGEPISRDEIIDRIKTWRKKQQRNKGVENIG